MALRSARERAFQTVLYEGCGFLLAMPFYMLATGAGVAGGVGLVVAMWVAVMLWTPVHNILWDWAEWHVAGRAASDRPKHLRILHALSTEASSVAVTVPILLTLGDLSLHAAVALEVALMLFYAAYAWVFHMVYDRWRPLPQTA